MKTCEWHKNDPLMKAYHDTEWGRKVIDDQKHFEFIILDCFQAGLSWKTILYRREGFRKAFKNFDYKKVARFKEKEIEKLMQDEKIIRNRQKIEASVKNAKAFMKIQKEFGSFNTYIWKFVNGKTIVNKHKTGATRKATSKESDAMSTDLKKRGFGFAGSTICYAYMQAAGMVNDHLVSCECYSKCK
jgi:DNA-3-methyladenine glycosylase I